MSGVLTVKGLGIQFGGLAALSNISFETQPGHITALIGPNGAGKTTLFNCLTGFYTPTQGDCLLNGVSLKERLGAGSWQRPLHKMYYQVFGGAHCVARLGVARTFQNIRLFQGMTVLENVLVALQARYQPHFVRGLLATPGHRRWTAQARETAFSWLDRFELTDKANCLAGDLSYGQKRYLEIARALAIEPKLLCLDEPAAGLNPSETQHLAKRLSDLQKDGLSLLLIEHDMPMVMSLADRVVVLDSGTLIAQGSPEAVQKNPDVIKAYLGDV